MGPAKQLLQAAKFLTPIKVFGEAKGTYRSVRNTVTDGTRFGDTIRRDVISISVYSNGGLGDALVVGRYGLCDLWANLLPDVRQSQGGNWFKQIEAA